MCAALARRHNRIATGWIHLRRAAARNHAYVRVSADDSDAVKLGGVERQKILGVLEEHDTLLGNPLRDLETAHDVDHAFLRRVIDDASGEHGTQNAMDMIVEFRLWNLSGFDRLLEFGTVKDLRRFFVIESRSRSLRRTMRCSPV